MITPADVLFAWDASHGIVPTVGGTPPFSRGGEKWVRTRARGGSPLYQRVVGDQVGFSWVEKDGVLLPRRALSLEHASTPLNDDAADWGSGGNQASGWPGTVTDATPVFAPPLPAAVGAGLWENNTGGFAQNINSLGTWTGTPHTFSVIIEEANNGTAGGNSLAGVYDSTVRSWVIRFGYEFDTETVNVAFGSLVLHEVLADRGPNGGKVVRIAVQGTGTPGNSRDWRMPRFGDGDSIYVHHVQIEERYYPTSPVVYAGFPATRPAEDMRFNPSPAPQDSVLYLSFVPGNVHEDFLRLVTLGDGSGARMTVQHSQTAGDVRLFLDDGSNTVSTDVDVNFSIGDFVEVVAIFRTSTGAIRILARADGGAVSDSANSPGSWSAPSAWANEDFNFNKSGSQANRNRAKYLRALMVPEAAPDAATNGTDNEALMNELADVPVGPQFAGHPS